jgi:NtrC-family two-component system response regulator AlgB
MNREESPQDPPPYLDTANAVMARAIGTARRVAESDVPVLLSGESGTGKHVLAKAIHRWSASPAAPFAALPGVAVTDHRHEGELFSCTQTTARADDEEFESIHGGTLFCEEVGDLLFGQQAKLVRLLDHHRFAEEDRVIWEGMRVIAASRRDLEAEVRAGRFRADLFFRLSVVTITLPPLRDRPEDLLTLTEYLLDYLTHRYHRHAVRPASEVQAVFGRYHWPGNVRELVSILERAVVLSRDDVITTRDLPERLLMAPPAAPATATAPVLSLEELERYHIQRAIAESSTLEEAAIRLGIDPTTLWRKRKRYGLT